jgi:hypothetical protein
MYGQTYLNIPLNDKVNKINTFDLPITKNGKRVGHCSVYAYAEGSVIIILFLDAKSKIVVKINKIKIKIIFRCN